jgi:hypothetical protein
MEAKLVTKVKKSKWKKIVRHARKATRPVIAGNFSAKSFTEKELKAISAYSKKVKNASSRNAANLELDKLIDKYYGGSAVREAAQILHKQIRGSDSDFRQAFVYAIENVVSTQGQKISKKKLKAILASAKKKRTSKLINTGMSEIGRVTTSYGVEVRSRGEIDFGSNDQRFATKFEAENYASAVYGKWPGVEEYRVFEDEKPANLVFDADSGLLSEAEPGSLLVASQT